MACWMLVKGEESSCCSHVSNCRKLCVQKVSPEGVQGSNAEEVWLAGVKGTPVGTVSPDVESHLEHSQCQ